MLRIFEAIKKSPFFNANFHFRPLSANASAEIVAFARLNFQQGSLARIARQRKTGVTPEFRIGSLTILITNQSQELLACAGIFEEDAREGRGGGC